MIILWILMGFSINNFRKIFIGFWEWMSSNVSCLSAFQSSLLLMSFGILLLFLLCWSLLYPRIFFQIYNSKLDNTLKVVTIMCLIGLSLNKTFHYYNGSDSPVLANIFLYFPFLFLPLKLYYIILSIKDSYYTIKTKVDQFRAQASWET